MNLPLTITFVFLHGLLHAHERSAQLTNFLNSPKPDWLSLGEPITVEKHPLSVPQVNQESFRESAGGATNTRTKAFVPSLNLSYGFPYQLLWRGGDNEGFGVSLSPDKSKIITNSGSPPYFRTYEIDGDQLHEINTQLPKITYDQEPKGVIHRWVWAADELLIGHAEVTDEEGHQLLETRLYSFRTDTKSLARLDLSNLNLDTQDPPLVEVLSIEKDLSQLVLEVGGEKLLVSADLKSPHKLVQEDRTTEQEKPDQAVQSTGPNNDSAPSPTGEEAPHSDSAPTIGLIGWSLVIISILTVVVFSIRKAR